VCEVGCLEVTQCVRAHSVRQCAVRLLCVATRLAKVVAVTVPDVDLKGLVATYSIEAVTYAQSCPWMP